MTQGAYVPRGPASLDGFEAVAEPFRRGRVTRVAVLVLAAAFFLDAWRSWLAFGDLGRLFGGTWLASPHARFELSGVVAALGAMSALAAWTAGTPRVARVALPAFLFALSLLIGRFHLFGGIFVPSFDVYHSMDSPGARPLIVLLFAAMAFALYRIVRAGERVSKPARAVFPLGLVFLGLLHGWVMFVLTFEGSGTLAHGPAAGFGLWVMVAASALAVASLAGQRSAPKAALVSVFLWSVAFVMYGLWLLAALTMEQDDVGWSEGSVWRVAGWAFLVAGVAVFVAGVAGDRRAPPDPLHMWR